MEFLFTIQNTRTYLFTLIHNDVMEGDMSHENFLDYIKKQLNQDVEKRFPWKILKKNWQNINSDQ